MGVDGIAAMSMAMSQQKIGQQIGMSVMKMAMDTAEQNSDMMIEGMASLQQAAQPDLGANVDILA